MADEVALRLSDDERWAAARVLDAAVADGRLTWDEHAERTGRVLAARTRGDLVPCLADLGPATPGGTPQRVVALASKITRTAETIREIHASAVFGAVVLDLSGLAPGEQVLVEASAFCGKVVLHVPDDATVVDEGTAVLGKRAISGAGHGGPVVRIRGRVTMGNLKVLRSRGITHGLMATGWNPSVGSRCRDEGVDHGHHRVPDLPALRSHLRTAHHTRR